MPEYSISLMPSSWHMPTCDKQCPLVRIPERQTVSHFEVSENGRARRAFKSAKRVSRSVINGEFPAKSSKKCQCIRVQRNWSVGRRIKRANCGWKISRAKLCVCACFSKIIQSLGLLRLVVVVRLPAPNVVSRRRLIWVLCSSGLRLCRKGVVVTLSRGHEIDQPQLDLSFHLNSPAAAIYSLWIPFVPPKE